MKDTSDKPATTNDLAWSVIIIVVILSLYFFSDSCMARMRYLDLRDRLERIETLER